MPRRTGAARRPAVRAGVPAADSGARAQRTEPREPSREFEPSSQTIRNWMRQADLDEGRRKDGLTTEERQELVRLRRETGSCAKSGRS